MSDWLSNPARTDEEIRTIRLVRYAVREEASKLLVIAFFAAAAVYLLLLRWSH
jgi:hypothetical protein